MILKYSWGSSEVKSLCRILRPIILCWVACLSRRPAICLILYFHPESITNSWVSFKTTVLQQTQCCRTVISVTWDTKAAGSCTPGLPRPWVSSMWAWITWWNPVSKTERGLERLTSLKQRTWVQSPAPTGWFTTTQNCSYSCLPLISACTCAHSAHAYKQAKHS